MPRRTDAFTLQELLIVMILSGILLSTAYYGLRVIQQYYHDFDKRNDRSLRYQTLHSLLQQDFEQADYVVQEHNAIVCYSTKGVIYYEFTDEAVVREQAGVTEVFPGFVQDRHGYFLAQEVGVDRQPISELRFTMALEEGLLLFRVRKTYAADVLINLTSPAWLD